VFRSLGAAGGWLQGGGHTALSNNYGLGVDRVLEFKVREPLLFQQKKGIDILL